MLPLFLLEPFDKGEVVALRFWELLPGFWSCSQDFGVAPRVLEFLPGFWSCSQGLRVKCENLSDLLYCPCSDICRKIWLFNLTKFVLDFTLNITGKCKKKLFFSQIHKAIIWTGLFHLYILFLSFISEKKSDFSLLIILNWLLPLKCDFTQHSFYYLRIEIILVVQNCSHVLNKAILRYNIFKLIKKKSNGYILSFFPATIDDTFVFKYW